MTFSYSGDPSSEPLDAVRFLVGDTDERLPLLSDEEIRWIISTWYERHPYLYASKAAEAISGKMSREISLTADSQSISLSELQDKYSRLATNLFRQYQELVAGGVDMHVGGMFSGEQPDLSIAPLSFGTRMHDVPGAGRQDFGEMDHYTSTAGQWGEYSP